ncbi:MAG: peptide-methionine (S)-S-oxide reductase [Chitinivibrionales bacterium]|nr:peptide-methionine (S)-S-oxide reductase [Chitinivibrionales bacterium]
MNGVYRTRVGYAGGLKENPTYRSIGDHTESIQIDFDSSVISFGELIRIFWEEHNPAAYTASQQYKAIAFYHDALQKEIIETTADSIAAVRGKVETEIKPFTHFYLAEAYHQKHTLRSHSSFMKQFERMYPDSLGFINSTAAAKVNGYLGRHAGIEEIERTVDNLGLDAESQQKLLTYAAR